MQNDPATGRAVVCTTSLERAELKRDQIHAYGPDKSIERCAGSMWVSALRKNGFAWS